MRKLNLWTMFAAGGVLLLATSAMAQQTMPQKICINTLNGGAAALTNLQGLENMGCLKKANNSKLTGTAQDCLTADFKGLITKRKNKTINDNTKFCATPPDFGYTGPTTINTAAVDASLGILTDVFGADLDAAAITCASNRPGCLCQQAIYANVKGLAALKLTIFRNCKRAALKAGATGAAALVDCITNVATTGSLAADTKGGIAKRITKLGTVATNKCDTPGVTAAALPGVCGSNTGSALANCLDARVECRVCHLLNSVDDLTADCDLFDDGTANFSCDAPPTPTPTVEPTATPTPDPALIFQGALVKSTGRFNYNAVLGLTGANAACNSNYPGSHACTTAELLAAESAGGLVGATDTASNLVTDFWAIDTTHPNTAQCATNIPWDYATFHTMHYGERMTLNNATGDLGAVQGGSGILCLTQRWVGCCL